MVSVRRQNGGGKTERAYVSIQVRLNRTKGARVDAKGRKEGMGILGEVCTLYGGDVLLQSSHC